VIVNLDVTRDSAAVNIDDPGGEPLTSPEVLEIQVVTGDLNAELAAIGLGVERVLRGTFTEEVVQIGIHGFYDIISNNIYL
jgi:hypothetical protein